MPQEVPLTQRWVIMPIRPKQEQEVESALDSLQTHTFRSIRGKLPKCLGCTTVVMPGEVQWSWTSPDISKPKEQAVAPYIFSY